MRENETALSPCGFNCGTCNFKEKCDGCRASGGKPFYIKDFDVPVCPIYDCSVNKNGYMTCAECPDVPCRIFYDWRDPSTPEEEHRRMVGVNVAALKEQK